MRPPGPTCHGTELQRVVAVTCKLVFESDRAKPRLCGVRRTPARVLTIFLSVGLAIGRHCDSFRTATAPAVKRHTSSMRRQSSRVLAFLTALIFTACATPLPPPDAYLTKALDIIHRKAYYADRVDWERITVEARQRAADARSPGDTHLAIRYALQQLGDNHSFLWEPEQSEADRENIYSGDFRLQSELIAGLGYVRVPGFVGSNPTRATAFADELQARIAALATASPCGWIVDLRQNTGGNMWPMLAGLGPLLGEARLGYFVDRNRKKLAWSYSSGASVFNEQPATRVSGKSYLVAAGKATVAVLQGSRTASSGEALVVAFRSRQNTRSFGHATAGLSSANESIVLDDGAVLFLTVAVLADRSGKVYGAKIDPDYVTEGGRANAPLPDDPDVEAASAWLRAQPSCTGQSS